MTEAQKKDLMIALFFLLGAVDASDGKMMYNSWTADQALSALCRLFNINEAALKLKNQGFMP